MTGTGQHLDMDALNELKQVMGDEFSLLIETFENDSVLRIEAIREAVATADPDAIRRAAHNFKGSAGNMGAAQLAELCRQMENRGVNRQSAGSEQLLEEIIDSYGQVKIAFAAL